MSDAEQDTLITPKVWRTSTPQAKTPHDYATQRWYANARKEDIAKLLDIVNGLNEGTRSLGEGSDTLKLWRAIDVRERARAEVERRVANGLSYLEAMRELKDEALLEEGIHAHPNPGP